MNLITIFFTSIGLAMDAFAVSISGGISLRKITLKDYLIIATFFGGFQFIMPLLGWFSGWFFRDFIVSFDHWIAFVLLFFIGGKMIYESFQDEEEEGIDFRNLSILLTLAIATSIDALAVGLTFSVIKTPIIEASTLIGIITFLICLFGVFVGSKFGSFFENQASIIG
ncbi:manganese efflux pump MntP family protein [Geminocystis sp. GBBB08]|uniref:manganese efflux pump MntP n=1 Tax=Geminocystis sp. GBBB08 TaxID=2604140 RepID=UPI0027E273B9|nr:manganese efflux pump MntP family protein [Geminocystis sp. GBBB08]MBL1209376.1 manganese efflux pump [Geminocystis sp. GBBB08]